MKFKQTEIGEIPQDWNASTISEVCKINPRDDLSILNINTEVSFIPMEAVAEDALGVIQTKIAKYGDVQKGYTPIGENDVLFAKITPCMENGKIAIARKLTNKFGFGSTEFYVLRPIGSVSSEWVFYWISRSEFRKFAISYFTGTGGQQRVNRKYFDDTKIPVPKIEEQQKITLVLSYLDSMIQQTDKIIEQARALKKGLMQELLTRGIGHKKFKQTEIGEIPEEWNIKKISEFSEVVTGSTPLTSVKAYWGGTIPWMASGDIHQARIRKVSGYITELGMQNSNTTLLPKDTVVIAMNGQGKTRGTVGILQVETTCNQSITGVIIKNGTVLPQYLYYNLQSRYSELRNLSGPEGRNGLNLRLIKQINVPIPSIVEQEKFVNLLISIDNKLESELEKRSQFEQLKKGLMQDLLTGKVRFPEFVTGAST